jgi:putative MATE family efflux protein
VDAITAQQKSRRLRVLWRLSWPSILEQLLGTMVSYMDTAMVGVLGKTATAAVSINAAPIWLLNGVMSGVGVGYSVQVANAVGARDEAKTRRVILQSLLAFVVVGVLFLALYSGLAGYIPVWLGAEPEVLPGAVRYLRLYALGMPLDAALYVLSPVFRCTGDTKTPLILNTLSNVTNTVLNFFLIYPTRQVTLSGHALTIPGAGMGVAGAAAASACAMTVAGLIMVVVAIRRFHLFARGTGDSLRPDRVVIRTACSLGLPYMAERTSINLGQIALTRVVASIGTTALAAHHIANTAEGLCYLPAYGISFAATALVGQAVGAQNREDARAYGSLAGKIGFALCMCTGVVLFAAARPLAGLFSPDQDVVALSALVLRIISFCEPFFALSIVVSGALRGANDTRCPLYISLGCMWVVRIALVLPVVFIFHRGLDAVWAIMAFDLFLRGILCLLRWRSGKWQRLAGFEAS